MMFICDKESDCIDCPKYYQDESCEHWIEVAPVRHGCWFVKRFGDDAQCSECGWSFADAYDADSHDRFCRHCGTEMCDLVLENKKVKSKTVYCGAIDCDDLTCDRNMENLLAMSVDDEVIIKSLQKTCRTYINKVIRMAVKASEGESQ